ncbi:MAG: hypothetical protein ACTSR3_02275 [Candidatus Helarchaeota archaeon]
MTEDDAIKALIIFNKATEDLYVNYIVSREFQINPHYIVSFLKATLMFAKKIGQSEAKIVDVEKLRLLFIEQQNIIFTIISTKLVSPIDTLSKLNTISTLFLNEFSEEMLNNEKKYRKQFSNFEVIIQEIIHGELTALENEKKSQIKKLLEELNEAETILGSGILSFSGKILVNTFNNHEINLINAIFNSMYEMKISGITKIFVEFQNLNFFSNKLNDEIVLVVMSKKGSSVANLEKDLEEIKSKISTIIK